MLQNLSHFHGYHGCLSTNTQIFMKFSAAYRSYIGYDSFAEFVRPEFLVWVRIK